MKYLVTGGAGFIGSHLVDRLLIEDHEVIVLDNFETGSVDNLSQHSKNPNLSIVKGTILDQIKVRELVHIVDRVIHLGASVGVFNIVNKPIESLRTNIRGSENVFEACLESRRPILIASSSEIYGKNASGKLNENSDRIIGAPQKIRWSYSDAKAIDEAIAFTLNKQFGLETRVVRLFNTVGPRQIGNYGMVVPRFIDAALHASPLMVYGDGSQTRCFAHVNDVIEAIYLLDNCAEAIGKPVNIGNSDEISILSLANLVIRLLGSRSEVILQDYVNAYSDGFEDMERRVPDTTLIRSLVGWKPKYNIEDIILDVSQWFEIQHKQLSSYEN